MNVFELIIFSLVCLGLGFLGHLISPRYGGLLAIVLFVPVFFLLLRGSFKEFRQRWKGLSSSDRVPGRAQPLSPHPFPSGFPSELASAALVASNEASWRPALAARSVEWFRTHGYAVLGTEIWLSKGGSRQSLPYFQNVERQGGEAWDLFVARAAEETLAYLRTFTPKFTGEGDAYVNVTWVSESEFRSSKA
jgi:hypothetical protein